MGTTADVSPFSSENGSTYYSINEEVVHVQSDGGQYQNWSAKFKERQHYLTHKFEYPRNGEEPGYILIINQETFQTLGSDKDRDGSRRDVNELVHTLQRQGYNIDAKRNIITNATTTEITKKLQEVAEMPELADVNCLMIFYLSHGDEFELLHTHDATIRTYKIWAPFEHCEALKNKPKMFVFQACKGGSHASPTNSDEQISPIVPYRTFSAEHIGSDMLVVYATIEGNISFRNTLAGTWFIQELCKTINSHGYKEDVASLIVRTTKSVSSSYYHVNDKGELRKQMPMFTSTLSKKFYLNRNKERDSLLRLLMTQERLNNELKTLKEASSGGDEDKAKGRRTVRGYTIWDYVWAIFYFDINRRD